MKKPTHAPSAWQIEQAVSALMSGRDRVLNDDPDLVSDQEQLSVLLKTEIEDVDELIRRVILASIEARAMADAATERGKAIKERADRFNTRADNLRATAFAAMDVLGMTRIEDAEFTASIARGRESVIITDPDAIPDEYKKVVRTPNKTAIIEAMKDGVVVPGAEVSNAMPTLQVRTK